MAEPLDNAPAGFTSPWAPQFAVQFGPFTVFPPLPPPPPPPPSTFTAGPNNTLVRVKYDRVTRGWDWD